jgi:shikimate dehydrogenase
MQGAAFEKAGVDAVYLALELDPQNFRRVARSLRATLLQGFNVTVPYKETILRYLDRVSHEAAVIGAVNTVKREGRFFKGYNTDASGFVRALREAGFRIRGKRAAVLGAGGAARAVIYGLWKEGAREILVLNRHSTRAVRLARDFKRRLAGICIAAFPLRPSVLKVALDRADLLVNATKVGLRQADSSLVSPDLFRGRRLFVCDSIYHRETPLLAAARSRRFGMLGGLPMLLHQGAESFEIWTGKKAPLGAMRAALHQAVEREPNERDEWVHKS